MKVFITGGRGFVGKNLAKALLTKGFHVVAVSRTPALNEITAANFRYLAADTTQPGTWQNELQDTDIVINLAGVSIFNYWTRRYKQAIYDSRILTTRNLVAALPASRNVTLINASALGYYGDRGEDLLSEQEPAGSDFLATVCADWEKEALKAESKGHRVIIARFGVVVDKSGGAMKLMLLPFRFFVGGPLGNGNQFFPWIHLADLIAAMVHLIERKELKGAFNFCAPEPIRNRDLAKTIGQLLRRPSFLAVPKFAIRLLIGELGSMVLYSQRGQPEQLLKSGFSFSYPNFKLALQEILS